MEEDVSGPRRVRAGPGADHPSRRESTLHRRVLEPLVQEVGNGHRHDVGQLTQIAAVPKQVAAEAQQGAQLPGTSPVEVGRGLVEQRAHHLNQPSDRLVVIQQRPRVVY